MPFNNFTMNVVKNPLVYSLYVQGFEEGGDFPPPPSSKFMITEISNQMVTETGNKMITE